MLLQLHLAGGSGKPTETVTMPCTTPGELLLVDGPNQYSGRVEVCSGGFWTQICDEKWSLFDARVVCHQLNVTAIGELAKTV